MRRAVGALFEGLARLVLAVLEALTSPWTWM
jgi:hypothetical protein